MKLSEHIKECQAMLAEHGDMTIVAAGGNDHNPTENVPSLHYAEEDDDWHGRVIICNDGEEFNPEKDHDGD